MKITALEITDYKRVRKVAITPAADKDVILIGGKNAAGKSSILDALTAAFGGKKAVASDPVRHGADEASVFVELDGGQLTIDRVIAVDGSSTIEVRDPDGLVKSPQTMLDRLVGERFLDPLAFLALDAKAQRAALMKMIPNAAMIDALNASRERGFTKRTEIGRDLKKAEGELARIPMTEPGTPIDVAALNAQLRAFNDQQHAAQKLVAAQTAADTKLLVERAARDAAAQRTTKIDGEIARLQAQIAGLETERGQCGAVIVVHDETIATLAAELRTATEAVEGAAKVWAETAEQRKKLDADLARADQHNRSHYEGVADVQRRNRAQVEVEKLKKDADEITAGLKKIEDGKAKILAAAKLPVEGLTITDDGIALNDVPFDQASGAERLRVALGLAIAASPGLDDVWIRDASLLDEDSLAIVAEHAHAAGKRCWLERVGTRDPGAIVISDGQVVS